MLTTMYPKIELHVHLEGTVQPSTLLEIARRNDVALPADTAEELQELFRFTDLAHFIDVWFLVTAALQTADDFRRITVDYAEEAARHGAVYIEGIFAPTVPAGTGSSWTRCSRATATASRRRASGSASRCGSRPT